MASPKPPKAVLFDIGGVCVLSPLQAILDFERAHSIPDSWINYAIRYSSPNGHWQRLERGEIKMNDAFFTGFSADLHNKEAWRDFHAEFRSETKKLKDVANPTLLGDHVSLKAEVADSRPTDQDMGVENGEIRKGGGERPNLSKLARDTTIGDPISLESEDVVESSYNSRINTNPPPSVKEPTFIPSPNAQKSSSRSSSASLPPLPQIDGTTLFWLMMSFSRSPDPYVFPALQHLLKQTPRPIVAALSNTVIYPPDHPWSKPKSQATTSASSIHDPTGFLFSPASLFDVYIASAEVGMRKPSRNIYDLALQKLDEYDKGKGGEGVRAEEVVFLDDIGENCKMGREFGMRTIRVRLGKTWRAVKELERVLGVELMEERTRRSKL